MPAPHRERNRTITATILPLPPELTESDALRPLAEQARAWVEGFVSEMAVPLTVEWYRVTNSPGEELVGVRVSDEHAAAHGVLYPPRPPWPDDYKARVAKVFNVMFRSSMEEQLRRYRRLGPATGAD